MIHTPLGDDSGSCVDCDDPLLKQGGLYRSLRTLGGESIRIQRALGGAGHGFRLRDFLPFGSPLRWEFISNSAGCPSMHRCIMAKARGLFASRGCWPGLEHFCCVSCQTRPLDAEPRRYAFSSAPCSAGTAGFGQGLLRQKIPRRCFRFNGSRDAQLFRLL